MDGQEAIKAVVLLDLKYYWWQYLYYYFSFERLLYGLATSILFSFFLIFIALGRNVSMFQLLKVTLTIVVFYVFFINLLSIIYSMYVLWSRGAREEVEYRFSDAGVIVSAKEFESRIQWIYFKSVKETRIDFQLKPKAGTVIFLPKLAFTELEDLIEVRKLFLEKLGGRAYLKS